MRRSGLEPPIRILATILASLLLAVGLAIAGYSYLLTLRRSPRPTAEAQPAVVGREVQQPTRLPPDPTLRREPVPASVVVDQPPSIRLQIAVQNLPPEVDLSTAGVALFATDTGAEFQWLPLAARRDGGWLEATSTVLGSLTVTLATSREHARHGYLASRTLAFGRSHLDGQTLTLDAAGQRVRFLLANESHNAGPLQVRRAGAPDWQASGVAPTGLVCRGATAVELLLGAGDYELVDPIDPTHRQRFTVPSPQPIRIREPLSRPATDRQ